LRLIQLRARGPTHAAKLGFKLLVAVLQLLDRARHLTDLRFEAFNAQHQFGGGRPRKVLPSRFRRICR